MRQYRYDISQNTDEWLTIKVGKFSASTCAELLMDKKTVGYKKLIDKIVEERITGMPTESQLWKGNAFTDRGHELEPVAREDYEFRTFNDVVIIGVIELDDWILCSPDGLIGDNGLYQAKCPIFNTQKGYLKNRKVPTNYYKQMQFELYVSDREYNVFNCYHPHLPAFDVTIERDEEMIYDIKQRLMEAIIEVQNEIKLLKAL